MPKPLPHLHIVLLCDAYGRALWPIARENAPACLAAAGPGQDGSLLSQTVERVRAFTDAPLHVVTTRQLAPLIEEELLACMDAASAGFDVDLLVEPVARGSAFSIALAASRIHVEDPAAVVAVFPSNQAVQVDDRWEHLVYRAYLAALQGRIAVLGGEQDETCAGYTYMRKGRRAEGVDDAFDVRLFAADGQPATAARAKREGALWYTGVLFARASVIMGELARAGEAGVTDDTRPASRIAATANFLAQLEPALWLKKEAQEVIETIPPVSFEKACLEVSGKLLAVSTTVPFSTLGSLEDVEALHEPDKQGNRAIGGGSFEKCRDTTVYKEPGGRTVVALGLNGVVVVDTQDALLVADRNHLEDLGEAIRGLES